MNLKITNGAKRVLSRNIEFSNNVYNALEDIEVVLDQTFFKGNVILEEGCEKLCLNLNPKQWMNDSCVFDLFEQINYIIKCNLELNLPLKLNGKIFR